jgi:hypothetical protein
MVDTLELHVPGTHTAQQLAPSILAFVRAHPCLFGVVDPAGLAAHATGPKHEGTWVLIDVAPRSVGAIAAEVDADRGRTQVRIRHHLWPVADPAIAVTPKQLLARYLGVSFKELVGERYMVDPATRRHTGCLPIFKTHLTEESSFSWRAGPVLICRGTVADVTPGAFVWAHGYSGGDPVLAELPIVLDPTGRPLDKPSIAPALRAPSDDDLAADVGECPHP